MSRGAESDSSSPSGAPIFQDTNDDNNNREEEKKEKEIVRNREWQNGLTFFTSGVGQSQPQREDYGKENKVCDLFPESLFRKSHVQRFRLHFVVSLDAVVGTGSSASAAAGYSDFLLVSWSNQWVNFS